MPGSNARALEKAKTLPAGAWRIATINGGRQAAPVFAGDMIDAWSEVLGRPAPSAGAGLGAPRLWTVAAKKRPCHDFSEKGGDGHDAPAMGPRLRLPGVDGAPRLTPASETGPAAPRRHRQKPDLAHKFRTGSAKKGKVSQTP